MKAISVRITIEGQSSNDVHDAVEINREITNALPSEVVEVLVDAIRGLGYDNVSIKEALQQAVDGF